MKYLDKFFQVWIDVEARNPLTKDAILCEKWDPENVRMLCVFNRLQLLIALRPLRVGYKSRHLNVSFAVQIKAYAAVPRGRNKDNDIVISYAYNKRTTII